MPDSAIVTRFAPSPTGFLHIGNARTALFNFVFARHHKGTFVLRIEDTDKERSTPAAIDAIFEGLTWLGIDWDGEPVFQSTRADRHREVAEAMLAKGTAYRCYATTQELDAMREKAKAEGRHFRYDGRWRDRPAGDAPKDAPFVVRLKAPREGETVIADEVQGEVRIRNDELDDIVLLRSDGTPTYMLAVVVDDHDMGITHVIRGDDHLINAARQTHIYQAAGFTVPTFAHLPLLHGPDGAKLSKRHGALGVDAYRDLGYLPETMRNYLMRLGWSHGDDEIFSMEQAIEWFDLGGVNKAAARIDFAKLDHMNGHYIKALSDKRAAELIEGTMTAAKGWTVAADHRERLLRCAPALKERAKTLIEMAENAHFLIAPRPIEANEKAAKSLTDEGRAALKGLIPALEAVKDWDHETVETAIRTYAEGAGLKFGQVAQPMRAALTGTTTSPGIFDVLYALGREESLARIRDQAGS